MSSHPAYIFCEHPENMPLSNGLLTTMCKENAPSTILCGMENTCSLYLSLHTYEGTSENINVHCA